VRQALNYILRGVRIGADRVKITLFLRGAERVHVPTVYQGCVVRRICIICCTVFNVYFTVMNKSGRIIQLHFPFLG
jgi:hypothetical protein